MTWRRSTRCSSAACVEVEPGPTWRRSTRCAGNNCVEADGGTTHVWIRNNQRPNHRLTITATQWAHLAHAITESEWTMTDTTPDNNGHVWYRSTQCSGGSCVEVAFADGGVFVRDSNSPTHVLAFTIDEWDAFVAGVNAGEFRFGDA